MKIKAFPDTAFKGLDNRAGDLRNRTDTIVASANVDLTDSREIKTRSGLEQKIALPNITSSFFTADGTKLYVASNGTIYRVYNDYTTKEIVSGLNTTRLYWSEMGNRIGISGTACGVIRTETEKYVPYPLHRPIQLSVTRIAGDMPAGQLMLTVIESINGEFTPAALFSVANITHGQSIRVQYTASANADFAEIYCTELDGSVYYEVATVIGTSTIEINASSPRRSVLNDRLTKVTALYSHDGPNAFFSSRWCVASYNQEADTTYIYKSEVFSYGLFDILSNYEPVPGKVTLLHTHNKELLIGTTQGIWVISAIGIMQRVSSTTVPEHVSSVVDSDGTIWFWTSEGLAKALPYEEVTAERLDPDSSTQVSLGLVKDRHGDKIIVVTKV